MGADHLQSSGRIRDLDITSSTTSFALALQISGAQRKLKLPRPPWSAPGSCPACLLVGVVLHGSLGSLRGGLQQSTFGAQQYLRGTPQLLRLRMHLPTAQHCEGLQLHAGTLNI